MMDEGAPDRRDVAHLGDTLVAGSSTGWTDEKHMLYIRLLEESFVSQLYDSEFNLKGLFCQSPRVWSHENSSQGSDKNTDVDQGCLGRVDVARSKPTISHIEHIRSPRCDNYGDRKVYCMDGNASSTEPVQEETSRHSRARSSGGSSASDFRKHRHFLSRSAEASDQNFIDEEIVEHGESSRGCIKKQLSYADGTINNKVVPFGKANLLQEVCHYTEDKNVQSHSLSKLDAEPASSSSKVQGPKG